MNSQGKQIFIKQVGITDPIITVYEYASDALYSSPEFRVNGRLIRKLEAGDTIECETGFTKVWASFLN